MGLRSLLSCFRKGNTTIISSPKNNATADELMLEEQLRGGAVLVELFTSQGCKTSPQAEELVDQLAGEQLAPVVVLDYHVDYWDYLGWKDPLASSLWTVRQKAYVEALRLDTLYTPLAVVHGHAHCLATDQDALLAAVRTAPRFPTPSFQASFKRESPGTLEVTLTGTLRWKVNESERAVLEVMVALYEKEWKRTAPKGRTEGGASTTTTLSGGSPSSNPSPPTRGAASPSVQ